MESEVSRDSRNTVLAVFVSPTLIILHSKLMNTDENLV